MNRAILKEAIRAARKRSKCVWFRTEGAKEVEMVSLPLPTLNLLLKAAKKELSRT